ncbi:MAG: hypothetical protein RL596_852 [Bacteroidota bacterium]
MNIVYLMKKKFSRLPIITLIKCIVIIGAIFFSNASVPKQLDTTSAYNLHAYNQKDPFGSGNDKTSAPLCLETREDDDDDDSVELRFYTKTKASNIRSAAAVRFSNYKPIGFTPDNRLPLYILFHAWRGFDC